MKDLQPDFDVDILVVGGGTAGCAAAIETKEALPHGLSLLSP